MTIQRVHLAYKSVFLLSFNENRVVFEYAIIFTNTNTVYDVRKRKVFSIILTRAVLTIDCLREKILKRNPIAGLSTKILYSTFFNVNV